MRAEAAITVAIIFRKREAILLSSAIPDIPHDMMLIRLMKSFASNGFRLIVKKEK